ncbi:MAG: hypothetical protein RBU25_08985 [Lentisphaeria bacterium]|jgi:hypothetical protein|nr:hypothetical protein [Lentisphaeria bacterium]
MRQAFRAFLRVAALAILAGAGGGCLGTNTQDQLQYTFAGYQHDDPEQVGGGLCRSLVDYDGKRTAYVRSLPLITTHNIVGGELVERPGGTYAVRLLLDRIGQDVWLQACSQLGGRRMAVAIDGFHVFDMTIPHRPANYEAILVEGPWEEGQARGVATHAALNFQILYPNLGR